MGKEMMSYPLKEMLAFKRCLLEEVPLEQVSALRDTRLPQMSPYKRCSLKLCPLRTGCLQKGGVCLKTIPLKLVSVK